MVKEERGRNDNIKAREGRREESSIILDG